MNRIVLLLVLVNVVVAQNAPNNQAETSGVCSPVVQTNQGKVQITCRTAMDEATKEKFAALLNQILNNVKDTKATNKKLDDLLEYITHFQATSITQGTGSIAQVGGTGNTATVVNTEEALPHVSFQILKNSGNLIEMRIHADKAYPGAMFAVTCDRPCEPTEGAIDWGENRPSVGFGPEVRWGHPGTSEHPVPYVAVFKVDFPAVLTTEYGVFATVKSADGSPLAVKQVGRFTVTGR